MVLQPSFVWFRLIVIIINSFSEIIIMVQSCHQSILYPAIFHSIYKAQIFIHFSYIHILHHVTCAHSIIWHNFFLFTMYRYYRCRLFGIFEYEGLDYLFSLSRLKNKSVICKWKIGSYGDIGYLLMDWCSDTSIRMRNIRIFWSCSYDLSFLRPQCLPCV